MAVVQVVRHEVAHQLFNYHALLVLQVSVEAGDKRVHLVIDRGVVSDLGFNGRHLLSFGVLGTELGRGLAVFIDFFLKCNLREIQLIAFR